MKKPIEGELFRRLSLHGRTFELRYGFYEDFERESDFKEPIPIYPDFLKDPIYTNDGYPFVTQMQDVCEWAESSAREDACCVDCKHFVQGEELIGLCKCEARRRKEPNTFPEVTPHSSSLEDTL